jgi:EAL domain-containing protein (putative c-di-GMP-specific phosphodiesterase class I)/GGDEF domain-containing protein
MFTRLRAKLTFLYAGLFGLAMIVIAIALYAAVSRNAVRMVRGELDASGGVFERIWALKDEQLRDGAGLLSRDFGFLTAVATHDTPTIVSSLDNLKDRFDLDLAFMIGVDGKTTGAGGAALGAAGNELFKSLDDASETSGVILIGGMPYQAVAVPVLSPTLIGWVVFATQLDEPRMQSFERLSAIPLDAAVVTRAAGGGWVMSGAVDRREQTAVNDFVGRSLRGQAEGAAELASPRGPAVALVKPLKSLNGAQPAALLLQYPLARALSPYRSLLETIALVGGAGLILLVWGSWILARGVTRPLTALAAAARRLQDGEDASVPVSSRDELGKLAESFNAMAAEIRARERKVAHLALHDHDSGLPNRVSLEQDVAALLAEKGDGLVVVAALGVDRFAHVRGAIGYALSNILVAEIGQRLTAPAYRAARLATDTVGVCFRAASLDAARRIVSRAQAALDRPLNVDGSDVDISLTVGLGAAPTHADAADMLVDRAIIALDQARSAKQKLAVFSDALYGDPAANLSLMSEMLSAAENGELDLHYQPKYDLRARKVSGMEALVRWNHARRGPLSPELFVGMAEETGHIRQLTDWVMRRAIDAQRTLHEAGHDLSVSINISARLLGEPDFAEEALATVTRAVGKVCFEITETAVIDDPQTALALIDRFAAAGVDISIDDYGSGLSSLAYLKQIHAHELKIDKQFVFTMGESQKDALLVRSTIDLAHSLGLKVTAEGVETDIACSLLAAMGCDYAQGYLIAKPMPLGRLLAFLSTDRRAEAPEPGKGGRQSGVA